MNSAAGVYLENIRSAFDSVVEWVFSRGCLLQFPRVVGYLGKDNGGSGWEDSYQNIMIDRLCASQWMRRRGDTSIWTCVADGSDWFRNSEEWRMGAFKETMSETGSSKQIKRTSEQLGASYSGERFFSDDFFRTVGIETGTLPKVTVRDVAQFLTQLRTGEFLIAEVSE